MILLTEVSMVPLKSINLQHAHIQDHPQGGFEIYDMHTYTEPPTCCTEGGNLPAC